MISQSNYMAKYIEHSPKVLQQFSFKGEKMTKKGV
jgi:hypothetical protein